MRAEAGADVREIVVKVDGVRLAGSLWWPTTAAASLIVMHPGSGPSDRHNDGYFPAIRSALLAAGHAVASFDKRGAGDSTGDWHRASIEQQADDLVAILAALRTEAPGVPVCLFGHSQGGWVVFEAVAHGSEISCAIANSGPGVSPLTQERFSVACRIRHDPARDELLGLFDLLTALIIVDEPAQAARLLEQEAWLEDRFGDVVRDPDEWRNAQLMFAHDPAPALALIDVPLLAIYGSDDRVVPVDASVAALSDLVPERLLEVAVVDGGDHRLQMRGSDQFGVGYFDTLTSFVDRVLSAA